jgi:hypothetical protein
LTAGGAIVVDDIDLNWGFHAFRQAFPGQRFLVCQARPIKPDLRRFDGKGLFAGPPFMIASSDYPEMLSKAG